MPEIKESIENAIRYLEVAHVPLACLPQRARHVGLKLRDRQAMPVAANRRDISQRPVRMLVCDLHRANLRQIHPCMSAVRAISPGTKQHVTGYVGTTRNTPSRTVNPYVVGSSPTPRSLDRPGDGPSSSGRASFAA
jgi:hypothetical protein